jgi:hypothetical protein
MFLPFSNISKIPRPYQMSFVVVLCDGYLKTLYDIELTYYSPVPLENNIHFLQWKTM